MTYYAFVENDEIVGRGQCPCEGEHLHSVEITEEVYNNIDHYIYDGESIVVNPNYEQEQADRREAEFNKAFFHTSLGYIRRSVTMADGSKKDFLSDLLLSIKAGLEQGLDVKILAYDKPPFTEDVEDWTEYQHVVSATPQFIMDCLMQTSNDFLPINEED